jgi:Xaa-Pro aminopeptidase
MIIQEERINTPVSTTELERRWAAIKKAMEANRIDVLLMQNNNDFLGGYVKYFTDVPASTGYPVTIVFPKDGPMIQISHGTTGMVEDLPPEGDGMIRGVRQVRMATSFAPVGYSVAYDAEATEEAMAPYADKVIGMVGLGTLPISIMDKLRNGKLSRAKFVDATEVVDRIKVIKSPEEIALIKRTAALQDNAMRAAFAAIKPGMKESDVVAVAEHAVINGGGEQGLYLSCSVPGNGPAGQAVTPIFRHVQNRVLKKGDVFYILIESNGPGGMYTELSRTCVLGKAPQELKDELALVLESRNATLDLLKPGASCKDIWDAHNSFRRKIKRPEETRLYCHGQGYDLVERPLVKFDEPMAIQEGMNLTCHPGWLSSRFYNAVTDNYLIGPNGVTEHIHKFPEIITEID